jgi:hypothetical protein
MLRNSEDQNMKVKKSRKLQLGSIKNELALCREAFADVEVGAFVLHCHHEKIGEMLTEPAENRIAYILSGKPKHEQALRFRLFRPVSKTLSEKFKEVYADYKAKLAPLYADYNAKCALLCADYKAKLAPLYADYNAKCALLYADYEAKCAPLYADYNAKLAPLYADYNAKLAPLYADYNAKLAPLHTKACHPGCPWNGKTIFL